MSEIIYKLNNRNNIKVSHALNTAHYNLGIVAQDILYALIAQIKNEDEELKTYHIGITDLENRLGRKLNRQSLKRAVQELLSEPIRFYKDENTEPFVWVKTFELNSRLGSIKIELHPQLKEHLIGLERFSMGNLESVLRLKSQYAKRLYMICAQYVTMKKFTIGIKALNDMFATPESVASAYGNFKERVIVPSVNTINEVSDTHVRFHEIKTGRFITDYEIFVYRKTTIKPKAPANNSGTTAVNEWLQSSEEDESVIDTEVA
jgi:plasmid replication initiation protein